MNNVSKKKIAAGYAVLLAVLLYSLFFVHREMENLMSSDNSHIPAYGQSDRAFEREGC